MTTDSLNCCLQWTSVYVSETIRYNDTIRFENILMLMFSFIRLSMFNYKTTFVLRFGFFSFDEKVHIKHMGKRANALGRLSESFVINIFKENLHFRRSTKKESIKKKTSLVIIQTIYSLDSWILVTISMICSANDLNTEHSCTFVHIVIIIFVLFLSLLCFWQFGMCTL